MMTMEELDRRSTEVYDAYRELDNYRDRIICAIENVYKLIGKPACDDLYFQIIAEAEQSNEYKKLDEKANRLSHHLYIDLVVDCHLSKNLASLISGFPYKTEP